MPHETLGKNCSNFENQASFSEVVFSIETPDNLGKLSLGDLEIEIGDDIDSEEPEEKPRKASPYSSSTTKGQVNFISNEYKKRGKGINSGWWMLPCPGDGNPRLVCRKTDCMDWYR